MTRDKKRTTELLKRIASLTLETESTFNQYEPEYDPNKTLDFIGDLLELTAAEGPVFMRVLQWLGKCYNVDEDKIYETLQAIDNKPKPHPQDCLCFACDVFPPLN